MPNEPNGNETPVSNTARHASRNERTEAKFFEDADKIIAEAEPLDADYQPPNPLAKDANLKAKRDAALAAANNAVITAQADSNTSRETLDKLAYTDADSLLNACISAKAYIKSKYKTTVQPDKNIAKTRVEQPSRLRKKK